MSISVRERMPLRLHCSVAIPSGPTYRWGADDPHAGNAPQALTFATTLPGGFQDSSLTLGRDPRLDYPDLVELSTLTVYGVGQQVAWQGRIEDLPSTYDPSSAGFNPQAVGWQAHLDDDDSASYVYLDRQLGSWQAPSTARQLALVSAGVWDTSLFQAQTRADASGSPCLEISGQGPLPVQQQDGEVWYDAGANNLVQYVRLGGVGLLNSLVNSGGWSPQLGGSSADSTFSSAVALTATGGAIVDLAGVGGPYRYAVLTGLYSGGAAGSAGVTYGWQFRNLALVGPHGLSIHAGPSGVSPGSDDGLLASDVIAHAIGAWCPMLAFSTGAGGTIAPSSYVIPQAAFLAPTTTSAIVKQAAQYELLDWAVWEGPTFYCNPRGGYSRARNWRARVGPSQLQATGPQASRLWNGVVVSYTGVDGRGYVIGPGQDSSLIDPDPENPANKVLDRYGRPLRRYAPLQMNGTSTQGAALKAAQVFLAEQKLLDSAGQATHTGHVQDDRGVWWPAWLMRAGDTVSYVDSSNTSARRIVSTGYADAQRANSVQLDQPPDAMDALLARLGASLSALGL